MIPTISHLTTISLPLLTYTGLAVLKCRNWQSCTSPAGTEARLFLSHRLSGKKRSVSMGCESTLPAPVENTEVMEANYARLLPGDLFGQIEKQSLAITPIVIHQQETGKKAKTTRSAGKKPVAPIAVKEVKVRQQAATIAAQPKAAPTVAAPAVQAVKTPYHIIIASVGSEKDADTMAQQLVAKGYAGAKAIIGDGKMRVSIQSCATEKEAYRALNLIRQNEAYKSAWVLKR